MAGFEFEMDAGDNTPVFTSENGDVFDFTFDITDSQEFTWGDVVIAMANAGLTSEDIAAVKSALLDLGDDEDE